MKKTSIIGLAKNATQITEALQEIGVVDIIQLNKDYDASSIEKLQSEKNSIINTIKYLAATPVTEKLSSDEKEAVEIIQRTTEVRTRLDAMSEERRKRQKQIEIWSNFGDFAPEKIIGLQKQNIFVQFFRASEAVFSTYNEEFTNYEVVEIARKGQKVFFMTMGTVLLDSPFYEELPLPDMSVNALEKELAALENDKQTLENEIKELALQKNKLIQTFVCKENQFNFQKALAQQVISGELFYLQGWVPEDALTPLKKLSDETGFILLSEEPGEADQPPTTHKNSTLGEMGESLIYIYDTPSYLDIDPSSTVFIFFTIFFGMIIADVGYGSLLLLMSLWLIRGKSKGARLFRRLSITLSISTILMGILTASYFAIPINRESLIGKIVYSVAFLYNDTTQREGLMSAMFVSLWVGIFNISWVNIYKAYHSKKLSPLGWIPALIGLIPLLKLLFGVPWSGWENVVGLWPLYIGIGFVAIMTAIETKTSLGGRIGAFAFSIYTVVQLIADLLSFLRIFALAMAGAKMAETFGMLFKMIMDGAGMVVGLTLGIIVLLIGHSINLVLNIMGGVIHGLRLNFIESYHWCLDGGGKKYNPLKTIKYETTA
jgi:V/A-type H+-transporting ATPase subunit I